MARYKKIYQDVIEDRIINEAQHIVSTKCTVRDAALVFHVGKTTIHKDVVERLEVIAKNQPKYKSLHEDVLKILGENRKDRHFRGGKATKEKYETIRAQREETLE